MMHWLCVKRYDPAFAFSVLEQRWNGRRGDSSTRWANEPRVSRKPRIRILSGRTLDDQILRLRRVFIVLRTSRSILQLRLQLSAMDFSYADHCGVRRGRGDGRGLGVGVGLGVALGVGVGVGSGATNAYTLLSPAT
jgi:hypothetical protein